MATPKTSEHGLEAILSVTWVLFANWEGQFHGTLKRIIHSCLIHENVILIFPNSGSRYD